MEYRHGPLRPLGTLAPAGEGVGWTAGALDRSSQLSAAIRKRIATYMSRCPVFLAWMEYTHDEIGGRFSTPGGSSIASDGTYYWRLDGADYLRVYGIPVPAEAIEHFEAMGWEPPSFGREEYLTVFHELLDRVGET